MRRSDLLPWPWCTLAATLALGAVLASAQPLPPRVFAFVEVLEGTDQDELRWPVAVAAASAEEIVVADAWGPRLLRFRRAGVSWGLAGVVQIPAVPVALAWDGRRYVVALREGRGLVAFEGPELARRALALPRGVVPGALAAYPNGDLLLFDHAGGRALRLGEGSEPSREVPIEGYVTALAPSPSGGFFAAVAAQAMVLRFGANGELDASWTLPPFEKIPAWPVGLAVEPGGTLLVVDRHAGRLLALDANGEPSGLGARKGWEPGLLLQPAAIARLPDGLVAVADGGNGRVQLFRRFEKNRAP